jgi:hypothetical protein
MFTREIVTTIILSVADIISNSPTAVFPIGTQWCTEARGKNAGQAPIEKLIVVDKPTFWSKTHKVQTKIIGNAPKEYIQTDEIKDYKFYVDRAQGHGGFYYAIQERSDESKLVRQCG